ncbi:MAG: hypothetical protein FJ299_15830, partial [Planctomycetes bacterium]|nr:hypothetical protein [Planctomycetota bacterium]
MSALALLWLACVPAALVQQPAAAGEASSEVARWREIALGTAAAHERNAALEQLFQRGRADSDAVLLEVLEQAQGEPALRAA